MAKNPKKPDEKTTIPPSTQTEPPMEPGKDPIAKLLGEKDTEIELLNTTNAELVAKNAELTSRVNQLESTKTAYGELIDKAKDAAASDLATITNLKGQVANLKPEHDRLTAAEGTADKTIAELRNLVANQAEEIANLPDGNLRAAPSEKVLAIAAIMGACVTVGNPMNAVKAACAQAACDSYEAMMREINKRDAAAREKTDAK